MFVVLIVVQDLCAIYDRSKVSTLVVTARHRLRRRVSTKHLKPILETVDGFVDNEGYGVPTLFIREPIPETVGMDVCCGARRRS